MGAIQLQQERSAGAASASLFSSPHLIGVAIYIFSSSVYFAALVSAYRVLSGPSAPAAGPLEVLSLLVLLASGALLLQAVRAKERVRVVELLLVLFLGLCFAGMQAATWGAQIGAGFTVGAEAGAGLYYLFVASHGLHVLGGIAALGWLSWKRREVTAGKLKAIILYWSYVVLLWPCLFLVLYR